MSEEPHDWLDDELNKLGELDAPETLLPRVMQVVRQKAAMPWYLRLLQGAAFRTVLLAFATVILGVFVLTNPLQYLSDFRLIAVPLKLATILLETVESLLLHNRLFNLPVLAIIVPAVLASYGLLVAAAASVQRLVGLQK